MSLAAAMGTLALATSAQAATTIVGAADFTLSSSSAAGATHDNLPAAFLAQLAPGDPGDITPSATSTLGSYPVSNLTDGDPTHAGTSSSWASGSAATVTLTLDFASADVAGIILNWGWGDRTPGDYEVKIDGISLGSIDVDTAGGTGSGQSNELNTYIIFDSVQSGATKIEVIGSNGNNSSWGFDEIEVYTGVVPEPSTTALLGLGGLALILRRRK